MLCYVSTSDSYPPPESAEVGVMGLRFQGPSVQVQGKSRAGNSHMRSVSVIIVKAVNCSISG